MDLHTQANSSRRLRGTLAFLLSTASSPFFRTVEHSIGIGKDKITKARDIAERVDQDVDEFGLPDMAADNLDSDIRSSSFPSFFCSHTQSGHPAV
jgi:hypothetical protein